MPGRKPERDRYIAQPFITMSNITYLFLVAFGLFGINVATAQVSGCPDPQAVNYNPQATINNGSCTYNPTSYTPPIRVDTLNTILEETSGLQWAAGALWTFNDGGGITAIYKIDTLTKNILQTVTLAGITNIDWEDIAFDGTFFYVGDFGNNLNGGRTNLTIYKFPISLIPDHTVSTSVTIPFGSIEKIMFTYSDQPQPAVAGAPNATKFDCEAMIVDGGQIHLFSKNWIDNNSTHYVINGLNAGTYTATAVETLQTNYLVTGADKAVGDNVVILLGYQVTGAADHFLHLLSNYSGGLYFNGNKRRIDLPNATVMGQAEGITFRNASYGYISNEKFTRTIPPFTITVVQALRSFNTSSFISQFILPLEVADFKVINRNETHEISWRFPSNMPDTRLQYSPEGTNFTVITSGRNTAAGHYTYAPAALTNYYRLQYINETGSVNYSQTILVKKNSKALMSNFSLTAAGVFTFAINEPLARRYSFSFFTADGKNLASQPARIYNQGVNNILLSNLRNLKGLINVVAKSDGETISKMIFVQ